jgi:hypothetical protein
MKRIIIASLLATVFTVGVSAAEKPDNATELAAAKKKLVELGERYPEKHPKVQQQVKIVQILEKQQQATK